MGDGTDQVMEELQDLWVDATEETVTRDLERARSLAAVVPANRREEALRWVEALRRLERWLHDR